MKKRMALLFGLVAIISSINAYALDIVIGGSPYPAYLFIPLAAVVLVWIILMLRWVIRHSKIISIFVYNVGKFVSELGFGAGIKKLMERLKEKKQQGPKPLLAGKEEKKAETPEEAKRDLSPYIEKISALEKKLEKSKNDDEILKELTSLVKDFFGALLNIHYAFTDEEMVQVLEKKKKSLVEFAQKISEIKFSGEKPTRKQLEELVTEFRRIAHKYVESGWKPKRVAKGVLERLAEQDKMIFDNVKNYVGYLKRENRKEQIESLLEDEQEILKRNVSSMKRTYNRILGMYVQLPPSEKAVVYPQLVQFYNNANKAIFSSVYGEKSRKELEYFVNELKRLKEMPPREPWLARMRASLFKEKEGKKETKVKIKEKLKAPVAPKSAKEELPGIKPLLDKLLKVFRPEEVSENKAKQMLKPKKEKKEKKLKLEEPTIRPLIEKFTDIKESFRGMFKKKIPTKEIPLEKMPAAAEGAEAMEQIGKLLESAPKIQKVDYLQKLKAKISKAWELLAACNFEEFDPLYEQIKLDFVNLNDNEQKAMRPQLDSLFNASEDSKREYTLKQAQELDVQKRKEEEEYAKKLDEAEKDKVKNQAGELLSQVQRELEEEEELEKEEEELLKLEEERKKRQAYSARRKDKIEALKEIAPIDEYFKEQEELAKEEEELLEWAEERKRRQEIADKRKAKLEALKIAEQIETQMKEQEELAKEEEELLEWAEGRKHRKEYAAKRKEKLKAIEEARRLDAALREQERTRKEQEEKLTQEEQIKLKKEKAAARREKSQVLKELEEFDAGFRKKVKEVEKKEDRQKRLEEIKLRREIEEHFKKEELRRKNEEEVLTREEERRRKELDIRRKETEKARAEKEKQWEKSVQGKSAEALDDLESQLRSVIADMDRKIAARPAVKIDMKEKLAHEAEVVRREVEARRLKEQPINGRKEAEKKKKAAMSPLEQEELKLLLELERIKKGL